MLFLFFLFLLLKRSRRSQIVSVLVIMYDCFELAMPVAFGYLSFFVMISECIHLAERLGLCDLALRAQV